MHLKNTAFSYFQSPDAEELSGWLGLLSITHAYADKPAILLENINRWQSQNINHPAAKQLPEKLQAALKVTPFAPQKIAVLLPLSGRFYKQGEAIQQGIISAQLEQQNSTRTLHFIDTEQWDTEAFIQQDYDFIIGPLLKDNINTLKALNLTTPQLWLNKINDNALADNEFSFGLPPEAEAIQAAQKMVELGYKKPIVLAAADSTGRRMSAAFEKTFFELTQVKPELSFFKNTDEMKHSVELLMETKQSRDRIKTIKLLFENPNQFEADARNRNDIDVIYIIADATQTQILKPFIDINTAPFARLIPIYASARSYSNELNSADMRDLNQIIFSDMPWRLPGHGNKAQLAQQMNAIWLDNADNLSAYFAFGYDSLQIIQYLAQMRVFPEFIHAGLTGDIKLNAQGYVERTLRWAQFDNGKISHVTPAK